MKKNSIYPFNEFGNRNEEVATAKLPPGISVGAIRSNSFDEKENSIQVEWSRGARALIQTWEGLAWEELDMSKSAIDMRRLQSGKAPVLDNHSRYGKTQDSVVGRVQAAKVSKGIGTATLVLSKRDSLKEFVEDVKDGIICNVSVGYKRIDVRQMADDEETGYPVYRVVKWEPHEISFTPVGADRDSGTRTDEENFIETEFTKKTKHKNKMKLTSEERRRLGTLLAQRNLSSEETTELEGLRAKANEEGIDLDALRSEFATEPKKTVEPDGKRNEGVSKEDAEKIGLEAVRKEKERVKEIELAVRSAGLKEDFAKKLTDDVNMSVDNARAKILEEFAKQDPNAGSRSVVIVGTDEASKTRGKMMDALAMRSNPGIVLDPKDDAKNSERVEGARAFRHYTLLDMAKEALEQTGLDIRGLAPMEIAKRAITSSTADFPILLEGTIRRVLLANYNIAADTWKRFCYVGSLSDFRTAERIRMGSFSRLDKVGENGEFKNKKISDGEKETIKAETYGNTINLSRQAIINDDLDAFSRLPQMLGRAAARSVEIDVYALLALNGGLGPNLVDGNTLFHASHNNIGSAAALTVESIDADRVLMATQKDPDSNDFLDLRPSILVLPIGLGGTARVLNDSKYDPDATNKLQKPNKVNGLYNDIVDTPRIAGTRRYSFADPNVEPVIEVAFLNGEQEPFMDMEEGFVVDGITWKVRHDYGVGGIGFRGAVTNAGA